MRRRRVRTTAVLQYEAAECGAAALGTILSFYGCHVPLAELREVCGVSRDGSNAKRLLQAARAYGLEAQAFRSSAEELRQQGELPCILFWGFNHYVVLEGFDGSYAYLSDPALGRRRLSFAEFVEQFTGVLLRCSPGPGFSRRGGGPGAVLATLLPLLGLFKVNLLQLVLLSVAITVPTLVVAGATSQFIDNYIKLSTLYVGVPIVWVSLVACAVLALLLISQFALLRRMESVLARRFSAELFSSLFSVPYRYYQQRSIGELATRMLIGIQMSQLLVKQCFRFLVSLLQSLLVLVASIFISPTLAVLAAIVLFSAAVLSSLINRAVHEQVISLSIATGKASGEALAAINAMETIKASGLEFSFLKRWMAPFAETLDRNQDIGQANALIAITSSGASFLLAALTIVIGGLEIIDGRLSLGQLVAFQFVEGQIGSAVLALPLISALYQQLQGASGRSNDLLSTEADPLVRSLQPIGPAQEAISWRGALSIRQLQFGFKAGEPPLLDGIDLDLNPGQHLAIVGSSGCGKSTLIRLIAGLYQPWSGEILYDGLPWLAYPDEVVRSQLAYVPQEVFVFTGTISDNLTLWNPAYDDADQLSAAADACLDAVILGHPDGLQRQLRDNGSDLSGGQRQRLEIARAFLRQPALLLLDEATSSLDNASEAAILAAIQRRRISVISVAHRLTTALAADQVVVMEAGRILEQGPPAVLAANPDGAFSQLLHLEGGKAT